MWRDRGLEICFKVCAHGRTQRGQRVVAPQKFSK